MEYYAQFQKICQIETRRWYVFIMGMVAITYLMFQSSMLPYADTIKSLLPDDKAPFGVSNVVLSKESSVESDSKGGINSAGDINVFNSSDHSANDIIVFNSSDNGMKNPVEVREVLSSDVGVDHEVEKSSQVNEIVELGHQNLGNSSTLEDVKERQRKDFPVLRKETKVTRVPRRNKVRPGMPPISVIPIDEMNRRLARHLASSSKMKPQWSSLRECDKEVVDAKVKIINAPGSLDDKQLYAPVFRNVSKFIRSYELMEKTLKVYIYKDGKKPIFHQPILKGLYASEGWFMKLMEGNKHFVVKDPEKAHIFYMPFSSRMLEYTLYVPGSHNRTKLRQFVKDYAETISAKYPFWNRTGGADHLAVACHDWALYETRHHMENSIKALCNADVTIGFKIGRDVSLPETYIRNARNPLRDLGGKPPSKRNILAFYAGNSHGYLRPTLLKHWKDKDPDMRIYGLLPTSVSKKLNYAQHMKSSKYCVCPKGFEVNSPRVVESIFYECVPVIISDNFVPPLFDILNWEAFSVFVAEKDIPNLKNILMSIPEDKYLEMQLAVRRVQRHFLWHARPVKYDLFYMTLHSIWYSRVFQIQKPVTGT